MNLITSVLLMSSLIPFVGGRLLGEPTNYEAVSSEPLTFEPPEEIYIDRRELRATSEIDGSDWASDFESDPADQLYDSSYDEFDEFDEFLGDEDEYDLEPTGEFDEDGFEVVGDAKEASLPIARKLRRIGSPDEMDETHPDDSTSVELSTGQNERHLGGCKTVAITIKVDKYGKETTVQLLKNGRPVLQSKNEIPSNGKKTITKCIPPGDYTLKAIDRDGICCKNGQGYVVLSVGGSELTRFGYFIGSKAVPIKIGYNVKTKMTARDKQWEASHNSRRRTYHRSAGKSYRALTWSTTLKSDATRWSNMLLNSCSKQGIQHQPSVSDGENLAKNIGKGSFGRLYTTDQIVGRWVEWEAKLPYPHNAHLTQVVWRPTQYVGCADATRNMSGGSTCRIQVCRYVRAGNCGVKNGNWRAFAFQDESPCGRTCPSEGCY